MLLEEQGIFLNYDDDYKMSDKNDKSFNLSCLLIDDDDDELTFDTRGSKLVAFDGT